MIPPGVFTMENSATWRLPLHILPINAELWGLLLSLAQSCPALCHIIDWSNPGFPVLHYLLEFSQAHVHWVGDVTQPSHPLSSLSPHVYTQISPECLNCFYSQHFWCQTCRVFTPSNSSVFRGNQRNVLQFNWILTLILGVSRDPTGVSPQDCHHFRCQSQAQVACPWTD